MEQMADRLSEKLHQLNDTQLVEVERFVESLQTWQRDREAAHFATRSSEPAFAAVWSNPEDEACDDLKPAAINPVFATIEQALIVRRLGALQPSDSTAVRATIATILG